MLEMIINPKKAERRPWEMFFVGIFYSCISVLLVSWIFSKDTVLADYSGILVVTFTVIFSLPFIYYTIKLEEKKVGMKLGMWKLLREHDRALMAFMWLFIGFVVGFSFLYIILPTTDSFRAQIDTYCLINRPSPSEFNACKVQYGSKDVAGATAFVPNIERLFLIFTNNIYVLIFTLVFSLLFGAGVIFVLAWNASVIGAAISIFSKSELSSLPVALFRYMIHGFPEIAAYFVAALAGGLVSVAVIKHEIGTEKFWDVLQDSLNLIIAAVIILFLAALIEVFVTPGIFN